MTEQLGTVQDDVVKLLALAYGGDQAKARSKVDELITLIRDQAAAGAETAVKPWAIAAIAAGGLGVAAGFTAIILHFTRGRK